MRHDDRCDGPSSAPGDISPSPKERGFASDLNAKNVTGSLTSEYLRLFSAVGEGKLRNDASVNYLYSSVAVKNILRFNSNAKFIVILRNPAEQVIVASRTGIQPE